MSLLLFDLGSGLVARGLARTLQVFRAMAHLFSVEPLRHDTPPASMYRFALEILDDPEEEDEQLFTFVFS